MKAVCRLYHKCDKCFRIYYTYVPHVCGEFFCRTCYVYHEPDKGCFISPIEDLKTSPQIIMVFDFEVQFQFSDFSFNNVLDNTRSSGERRNLRTFRQFYLL